MQELVLIRGVPGSGKSTLAMSDEFRGYQHYEADMFFVGLDGVYRYVPQQIGAAHQWCQQQTWVALVDGKNVVVSK